MERRFKAAFSQACALHIGPFLGVSTVVGHLPALLKFCPSLQSSGICAVSFDSHIGSSCNSTKSDGEGRYNRCRKFATDKQILTVPPAATAILVESDR
jgi:hypothetical protein